MTSADATGIDVPSRSSMWRTLGATLRSTLGRRPWEAALVGAGTFLIAGLPAIYFWLIWTLAVTNYMLVLGAGESAAVEIEYFSLHLAAAIVVGVVSWSGAFGMCWLIAKLRRLAVFTMVLAGYPFFVTPFAIWFLILGY